MEMVCVINIVWIWKQCTFLGQFDAVCLSYSISGAGDKGPGAIKFEIFAGPDEIHKDKVED